MTADQIMRAIEAMDNGERIKLLNRLFDNYFDSRPPKEQIIKEKEEMFWGKEDQL
jgi:hypothetical protein